MYIEFVINYFLFGFLGLLLITVIILQCVILRKLSRKGRRSGDTLYSPYSRANVYMGDNRGTAICHNCATQFDAEHSVCPNCGAHR